MNVIGFTLAHGIAAGPGADAGMTRLDAEDRGAVLAASGIRHAAAYGLQAALCMLAANAAIAAAPGTTPAERRALLTNGGPSAADTALGFLRSASERGHSSSIP
jgi:hypothetical protein